MNSPSQNDADRASRFTQLKWTLQALAASASDQLSLFPDFVCKADELALGFDDSRMTVVSHYASDLTVDQAAALAAIDVKLGRMSRLGSEYVEECWTDAGLDRRPEWARIRELAKRALSAFNWPDDLPPRDPADRGVTYVPGKHAFS